MKYNDFIEYLNIFLDFFDLFFPIILIIFCIVFFSGLFTAIETAILVISEAKVLKLSKKEEKNSKYLFDVKKNISSSISSIVTINNIISIMGTTILTQYTVKKIGIEFTALSSILLTIFIIIYGKIIPKIIGEKYNDKIALSASKFIYYFSYLLKPFNFIITFNTKIFSKGNKTKTDEEDIRYQLKIANSNGVLSHDKFNYLESIFSLTNKNITDVMTPSTQLEYLNEKDNLFNSDIKHYIKTSSHSRIIVVGKDINEIRGYFLKNDAFLKYMDNPTIDELNVSRITKSVLIIEENINLNELLFKFQKEHHLIAVVKNKFGVTLGVITLEDIIEQIIGEIVDETDKYNDLRIVGKEKFKKFMELNYNKK